jgi:ubiquitin-conjugating enzyme E2 Q
VVNRTDRFVHTSPHYVVSNIDWIQTRYLFVKSSTPTRFSGQPSAVYEQDPSRLAFNEQQQAILIPITAISKSRRPGTKIELTETGSTKRNKTVVITDQATAERLEDDANSIASDDEDLNLLVPSIVEDCEIAFGKYNGLSSPNASLESKGKKRSAEDSGETDFVPGSLSVDGIQFLAPPNDATRTSTQALMRSFREVLEVQESNPLSRLGWYIDSNLVNNMYQWIVELHSFPPHLPLSKDLKAAWLTSVVLEMRFSSNYPFTPPFIRVVKPRFLPFGQGGGGNVTEGGAMCMEILTNNGWTAAQAIDGLLLQVRMAICDEERPARLASRGHGGVRGSETYGIGEAVAAYIRACRNHGWTVPDGFEKLGQE